MQKSLHQYLAIGLSITALVTIAEVANAAGSNQSALLQSRSQASVNKAFARAYRASDPQVRRGSTLVTSSGCSSNVGVGNVVLGPGQRTPRNVTIALRDVTVVNVNRGCR